MLIMIYDYSLHMDLRKHYIETLLKRMVYAESNHYLYTSVSLPLIYI